MAARLTLLIDPDGGTDLSEVEAWCRHARSLGAAAHSPVVPVEDGPRLTVEVSVRKSLLPDGDAPAPAGFGDKPRR